MSTLDADRLDRLRRAEELLKHAQSSADLDRAHALLSDVIHRNRRAADKSYGTLVQSFQAGMQIWDAQKRDGVSEADRADGLAKTLQSAWPARHRWTYTCEACLDTGLVVKVCRPGDRCDGISTQTAAPNQKPSLHQRLCRNESNYEHSYGRPCYCEKGRRFQIQQPRTPTDDETSASKSLSKFGRK